MELTYEMKQMYNTFIPKMLTFSLSLKITSDFLKTAYKLLYSTSNFTT